MSSRLQKAGPVMEPLRTLDTPVATQGHPESSSPPRPADHLEGRMVGNLLLIALPWVIVWFAAIFMMVVWLSR